MSSFDPLLHQRTWVPRLAIAAVLLALSLVVLSTLFFAVWLAIK